MRSIQAKLEVSCFNRFGLDFPLKPSNTKKERLWKSQQSSGWKTKRKIKLAKHSVCTLILNKIMTYMMAFVSKMACKTNNDISISWLSKRRQCKMKTTAIHPHCYTLISTMSRIAPHAEFGYFIYNRPFCRFHITSCLTELCVSWWELRLGDTLWCLSYSSWISSAFISGHISYSDLNFSFTKAKQNPFWLVFIFKDNREI